MSRAVNKDIKSLVANAALNELAKCLDSSFFNTNNVLFSVMEEKVGGPARDVHTFSR